MSENSEENKSGCKVVLLGDSGVGKTCIISRYVSGNYDQNVASTNGASYATKEIKLDNGQILGVDLWDTAGQEKYKAIAKFFYKDAAICVLIYDITRKESFDNVKNYWYPKLKENGEKNFVLGVAGNKCDDYENEAVPENDAREFAQSVGAIFALTSAKENQGINEMFKTLANKYIDPNFQQKWNEDKQERNEASPKPNITINKEDVKPVKKKRGSFC